MPVETSKISVPHKEIHNARDLNSICFFQTCSIRWYSFVNDFYVRRSLLFFNLVYYIPLGQETFSTRDLVRNGVM